MATVAGIDIGAEVIKGVVLGKKGTGPIQLLAAGTQPIGELGHLADGTDKLLAIGEKLKGLVRTAHLKADVRRVGVGGSKCTVRYLQVPPVPPWRLDMLVKYEIEEKGGSEDAQTFDYRILDAPEVGGQYTVLVGALKETTASELLELGRNSALGEVQIDLEALALYNAYYHGHGFDPDKTVLVVDLGADDITILLVKGGSLHFGRTMLGGGRRFTQVLADELKIDLLEAEELKIKHAQILFDQIAQPTAGRTGRIARPGMTSVLPRSPGASGIAGISQGLSTTLRPGAGVAGMSGVAVSVGNRPAAMMLPKAPMTTVVKAQPPAKPAPTADDMPETLSLDLGEGEADTPQSPQSASVPPASTSAPATTESEALDLTVPSLSFGADEPQAATLNSPANSTLIQTGQSLPNIVANSGVSSLALEFNEAKASESSPSFSAPQDANASEPIDINRSANSHQMLVAISQSAKISTVLVREAASLCAMLENAVQACRLQYKIRDLKVDRVYLTGGASQLKGLTEFMTRRMRLEVQPLEPLRMIGLESLPVAQKTALKAEQHQLAIALGLAIGELEKDTISFVLLPESVKQRKIFWARGAYVGYAAALAALTMGLLIYTPMRNTSALANNNEIAQKAIAFAQQENTTIKNLMDVNKERHQQYKQISDNTNSGHYFETLLAELRTPKRIPDDIYLTSISTSMPTVVRLRSDGTLPPDAPKSISSKDGMAKAAKDNAEPDTFQAQRRVYIRGFARSGDKVELIEKIEIFKRLLVPHYDTPDHPDNLFKDLRTVWTNFEDQQDGAFSLKEFVLEAYTENTATATVVAKTEKTPVAVGAEPRANNANKPINNINENAVLTTPVTTPVVPAAKPIEKVTPKLPSAPTGKFVLPTGK